MNSKGFSLIELMVVIILISILSVAGVAMFTRQMKDHKLIQYAGNMEYLVKYAKMAAIERTTNVEICISNNILTIYNLGTTRPNAKVCAGTQMNGMSIDNADVSGSHITLSGTSVSVDPRGFPIYPPDGGNVCVSNEGQYFKVYVQKTGVRTQEGAGRCP